MEIDPVWLVIGFLGQALFSMRFIVQWLSSERQKRSVVPLSFWYLSIAGGATLCAYAIHRADPVFIVGQGAGLFIYARNLHLIHRARARDAR
ncbi:MAG: lipid-A-disaccharide synthase N-terminal domain-containing protein [Rhodocyclaceae bacterium]